MRGRSKRKGTCVHIQLTHFLVQQKLTLYSTYTPSKIKFKPYRLYLYENKSFVTKKKKKRIETRRDITR